MPTLPEIAARGHVVEFAWNLVDNSEMKAYCRRCEVWFCAACADSTDYVVIRQSQQNAARPFGSFDCFSASL